MAKKIVLSIELLEVKKGGVEIFAVNLSDDAIEGLSTNGAEIPLPPEAELRPQSRRTISKAIASSIKRLARGSSRLNNGD